MADHLLALPDAEIVAGVRAGDGQLFDRLFQAYYVPLCEFAYYFVRSMDVAEEVVADVLAAIWDGRTTWTPTTSVAAYLYGAVRNRGRNALRGERRAGKWRERFANTGDTPAFGTHEAPTDAAIDAEDRARVLHDTLAHALAQLPDRARVVVTLRWHRHLSYDEIAEVVGSTSAAVQMQMSRALKLLREYVPDDVW